MPVPKYEEAAELLYHYKKKGDTDIVAGLHKMMITLATPKMIDRINEHFSIIEQVRGPVKKKQERP